MSLGPADARFESETRAPHIAGSAVVIGAARLGEGSLLAQGAVIRSTRGGVEVGTESCARVQW